MKQYLCIGLLLASCLASSSAWAQFTSKYGVHVGFEDTSNTYIYCTPFNITRSPTGDSVTVRFRRFTSDGTVTNNVTTAKAQNRARIVCSNKLGRKAVVSADWSSSSDQASVTCPPDFPSGAFAECAVKTTSAVTSPLVYRGTACGNGFSGISGPGLTGQLTGTRDGPRVSQNGIPASFLFQDTGLQAGVTGTDLGIPFYSNGSMYYVFGDTNKIGSSQIHSALARTTMIEPVPLVEGIMFDDWYGGSSAAQVIHNMDDECVCGCTGAVPTAAWSLTQGANTFRYIFFMSVRTWNYIEATNTECPNGEAGVLRVNRGSIAFSMNNGPWHRIDEERNVSWGQNSNFTSTAAYHQLIGSGSGYVYLYGVHIDKGMPGANSAVYLMRVPAVHSSIVTSQANYQYWNGSNWVAEEAQAVSITPPGRVFREISVAFNSYTNRYILLGADDWVPLQSESLTGPFTPIPNANMLTQFTTYAPLTHDRLMTNQGRSMFHVMSEWGSFSAVPTVYQVGMWKSFISRDVVPGCIPDAQ